MPREHFGGTTCAEPLQTAMKYSQSRLLNGSSCFDSDLRARSLVLRLVLGSATTMWRELRISRCITLLLLFWVALFAPLSYADLPDQTSLGGLRDGGDNDDVILQLEATGAVV